MLLSSFFIVIASFLCKLVYRKNNYRKNYMFLTLQYYHVWYTGGTVNGIRFFCTFLLIMAAVIHQ